LLTSEFAIAARMKRMLSWRHHYYMELRDSQISLLPLGFSPLSYSSDWESRILFSVTNRKGIGTGPRQSLESQVPRSRIAKNHWVETAAGRY